jgi:hypothetical protein
MRLVTRLVTGEPVAAFVGDRYGEPFVPPYAAIGLEKDRRIVAGGVFNHYTGADIHLTIAAEHGAITRRLLRAWGAYVRDICGCERVTMITEQPFVADMAKRLGGAEEGRMRNHFGPGRDGIVLGILRRDWRF